MIREVNLLSFLPEFVQEYREIKHIMNSEQPEIQKLEDETEIIKNNQFILSCDIDGIARFENGNSSSIPKQELVDLMITSYKLSPHKLKSSHALHIVCWEPSDDFSMDRVIG